MLGSVHEAEDLVQETHLRAWRSRDTFKGRASVRTYLYRIATNVCLTALGQRARRAMPSDLTAPDQEWLQPIPDKLLITGSGPADLVQANTGIRLVFIAAFAASAADPARCVVLAYGGGGRGIGHHTGGRE